MANGGAEQGEPSQDNALSETLSGDKSSPKAAIPNGEGPGLTGLMLSRVEERLRDLRTDSALPTQEQQHLHLFYTRERNKLQLQLAVLGKTEKLRSCESALEEARKSLDFARSEGGRQDARRKWQARIADNAQGNVIENSFGLSSFPDSPEEDEIRKAEAKLSLVEATLMNARSELQTAAAECSRGSA
jgi:hypothetical protein